MPSLWKRDRSKYWTCCYIAADGRQMKRSTKCVKHSDALAACLAIQAAEDAARAGAATETQFRRILSDTMERVTGQKLKVHSCRQWMTEWVEAKKGSVGAKSLSKYQQVTRDFVKYLRRKADLKLEAVTAADVVGFRDRLRVEGRSASTVNQLVHKTLSIAFGHAQRAGVIPFNPCATVPRLEDDAAARDAFTPEQVAKLLRAADGDWKGVILAGYFIGGRLQDVCNLRWENFANGVVSFVPLKTKRRKPQGLTVPIHPELAAYLRKRDRHPSGFLFPDLAGQSAPGRSGLSRQFVAIMEQAKVKGTVARTRVEGSKGRTFQTLTFHSLRHSCTTALANAGVPEEIRQEIVGHADSRSHKRYTHHAPQRIKDAVASVPMLPKPC